MQTGNSITCDTPAEPGCQKIGAVASVCQVEGRQYHLCHNCSRVWKAYAHGDEQLSVRCPICAPHYVQRAEQSDMSRAMAERARYRVTPDDPILQGPLADVLDNAMFVEGVLAPTRRAVLARLYRLTEADDSGYVAMLLAQMHKPQVPA